MPKKLQTATVSPFSPEQIDALSKMMGQQLAMFTQGNATRITGDPAKQKPNGKTPRPIDSQQSIPAGAGTAVQYAKQIEALGVPGMTLHDVKTSQNRESKRFGETYLVVKVELPGFRPAYLSLWPE